MELGKNIAALRRQKGMTQEQLGQALGVSGQAVSKWEKGGAPDTELLPSIADRLGVTIDTLFGRADEPTENMSETLMRWLGAIPAEKRMIELFRLLCVTFQRPYYVNESTLGDLMDSVFVHLPIKSCYSTDIINHTEETLWMRSSAVLDNGIQLGVPAEDCPMFLLMPEPEGGYEANLIDNDRYRKLFSALALPGALELVRTLYGRKTGYCSAKAIAKAAGISPEDAERALSALCDCNVLKKSQVELETSPVEVYTLSDLEAFVPFLLFSRWMCDRGKAYICSWDDRKRPLLKKREEENHEGNGI